MRKTIVTFSVNRCAHLGLAMAISLTAIAAGLCDLNATMAADTYAPFDGPKTTWHGFDRYDYLMDDASGDVKPATQGAKGRQCIVVVPKQPAAGYPWSWQGCYWDHQPQTEVELLKRGFHIAFCAPDGGRQGKAWDRWYAFLTEKHGMAKKSAFVGMSKGGVNEFNWGVVNPDKVACIYVCCGRMLWRSRTFTIGQAA
jgi:hypothetical protein